MPEITTLPAELSLDMDNDYLIVNDTSEGALNKVSPAALLGADLLEIRENGAPGGQHVLEIVCGDRTTAIPAGSNVGSRAMAYGFRLSEVQAYLTDAATSGIFTVDIEVNGVSILSTKITIDAGERTSLSAAVAAVLSTTEIGRGAEVTVNVDDDASGDAAGLQVYLIGEKDASIPDAIMGVAAPVNSPADLGADLALWLRASNIAGVDGDAVAAWNSNAPATVNFAQGTAGSRPTLKIVSGAKLVRFDGVDDYLTAGDAMDLGTDSLSVFIVAKRTAADGAFIAKTAGGGQGRWGWLYSAGDGIYGGVYQDSAGLKTHGESDNAATDSDFALYELHIDRANGVMDLYRDTVLEESEALTADAGDPIDNTNALNIGAYLVPALPAHLAGDVKEIFISKAADVISGTQLDDLRQYAKDEHSLTGY